MGDDVTRQDAGAEGGSIVDRRHHLDEAVLHRDLDPQSAELALGLDLHILEVLGAQIARVGIERGQHAVDGGFDQLLVAYFLDIVRPHPLEYFAKQIELTIGVGRILGGSAIRQGEKKKSESTDCDFPHHPLTLSPPIWSQGKGSIGWLARRNST